MSFDLHRRYPLLGPLLALMGGIYGSALCGAPSFLTAATVLVLGVFVAWRLPKWRGLAACGLVFLLGAWRGAPVFPASLPSPMAGWVSEKRTVKSVFRVADYPRCDVRHCRGTARLLGWEEDGVFRPLPERGISLRVWQPGATWVPGEVYRADLKFSAPRRFKNPHGFDYPEYLRRQGLSALASTRQLELSDRLKTAPAWQAMAADFRRTRLAWLREELPSSPGRAVLEAFLFAEESGLGPHAAEVFRRTGLTHVLVVSGLHFVFLSFCFYGPLAWFLSLFPRLSEGGGAIFLAFALAFLPNLFYAFAVGLSPSVLRSLTSSALLGFALLGGWRRNILSALLAAMVLLLAARPNLLFSVSFQLSFASVATLVLLGRAWRSGHEPGSPEAPWWRRLGRGAASAFGSAVGVNLALAPWLAGGFHEFSFVAPLANLLLVPLFSIALPCGLALSLLGTAEARLSAWLLGLLHRGMEEVFGLMERVADLSWSSFLVAPWSWWEGLAYLALLAALFRPRPWWRSALVLAVMGLLLGLGEGTRRAGIEKGRLSLTMFDVGQGESLLLELPEGQALLLDGGGFPGSSFDVGRNVLMPELLARGRRRLSAHVLSHADADHAQGLVYLVDRLPPEEFWVGAGTERSPGFSRLERALRRRGVPLRILRQGEKWSFGGAQFEVLWPPSHRAGLSNNNRSLVLRVCHGELCFLLTGDIEAEAERGIQASARATAVLKVAHHGSKTSSSAKFLEAWRPEIALISAGEGNRYRLPHPQVLAELEGRGISVLRTDRDGQVRVSGDGKSLERSRFRESRAPSRWPAIRAAAFGSGS